MYRAVHAALLGRRTFLVFVVLATAVSLYFINERLALRSVLPRYCAAIDVVDYRSFRSFFEVPSSTHR